MILALGILFGLGVLLLASPFLWPRRVGAGTRKTRGEVLRARLAQAGLSRISPSAFVLACVMAAVAAAALGLAMTGVVALAWAAGAVGVLLPILGVGGRIRARRRANRSVWPDVVDHLVSAVRSGMALPDGVAALGVNGPAATREVFSEFGRDYRATGNFSACLDRLKERLADATADRILETLRMAREVGGTDLTAVLRALAAYLREEAAIRAEVEARQSWVVNAARLGVAAPWVVLVLLSTRPEAARAYNTATGMVVIVAGFLLSLLAYRVMLALGRLPEAKRSFR